ncbi:hypothetical protein J3B02_002345 [Coemansia erecta]|uniref:DUF1688-domain-containing protein n=1 Tax=Coemansia asiatica TaxID=1052880 RepID=A0A9W7XHW4_9FUNG|nr:hypothetical protein LPJ64_004987 [Coemansia asiatica]KAJ2855089.1 hypothetical protein J3B02_002345 [Coemansia erecta]
MTSPSTRPVSSSDSVRFLRSLDAVRQRSEAVYALGQQGRLQHFALDESKIVNVAEYVISLIARDHGSIDSVPTHGRWRSYCVTIAGEQRDLVSEHVARWRAAGINERECARRIIDLFVVSVLIDAGAGSQWKYQDKEAGTLTRTEGLGMAALRMFENGAFSSSADNPFQADAPALVNLTDELLLKGFQVSEDNPLLGASNRAELLRRLGAALVQQTRFFGDKSKADSPRPGFMLDYLANCADKETVGIDDLWEVIVEGFAPVWPASRTQLDGVSLGDVWPCTTLAKQARDQNSDIECLVPFHKLSQWLTWSLLEVIVRLGRLTVADTSKLTGLPEYRNGGLFVDMDVLALNEIDRIRGLAHPEARQVPLFDGSDPVIVEWRALTVALLDRVADIIKQKCCADGVVPDMFLGRVLEGGTWKAGREMAAELRCDTKDPPINIVSDGTLF